jgi:GNAT superfamily N-acetyltransferase
MSTPELGSVCFDVVAQPDLVEHPQGNIAYNMLAEQFNWYSPIATFCAAPGDNRIVIATIDTEPPRLVGVGLVSFGTTHDWETERSDPQMVTERLLVPSVYRNQGIGSLVLARCEALAVSERFTTAWIKPRTERNVRLYQQKGYRFTVPASAMMSKPLPLNDTSNEQNVS